ncbi:MAG: hypothetical protein P8Y92_04410 [Halioglobus sp.]|jgi:hypothetical protein
MTRKALDVGAVVHASAGLLALVLGGLMYRYAWAQPLFAGPHAHLAREALAEFDLEPLSSWLGQRLT